MIAGPSIIPVGGELPPLDGEPAAPSEVQAVPPRDRSKVKPWKGAARATVAGRFRQLNDFVDVTLRGLTHAERSVWLILFRDTRDGTARTAQADLARRAGIGVRTVQRAVKRLTERGLLRVIRPGRLRGGPSDYAISAMLPASTDA